MQAEWVMVIITAVYVVATILICWSNYKLLKAAQEQVQEMKREYDESNRPIVDIELQFIKRAVYCLRLANNGRKTAKNVRVHISDDYIDSLKESSMNGAAMAELLKNQNEKRCIIGVRQKHDIYVAGVGYKNYSKKVPIMGTLSYEGGGKHYCEEFEIDLDNYFIFFSSKPDSELYLDLIKSQNSILKRIEKELTRK